MTDDNIDIEDLAPDERVVYNFTPGQRRHMWGLVDASAGPDECWPWRGATNAKGYGLVSWWDAEIKRKFTSTAQRTIYALSRKALRLPDDRQVDHTCGRHDCCNPRHLRLLDPYVNNMAGNGEGAKNKRKMSCVNGHPFDEANTRHVAYKDTGRHHRVCRRCEADKAKRRRQQVKSLPRARADHCRNGHDMTDRNNVRIDYRKDGRVSRACRACQRDRARIRYQQKRNAS